MNVLVIYYNKVYFLFNIFFIQYIFIISTMINHDNSDKSIDDFTGKCHCGDPEWKEFQKIRENESFFDYGKRMCPKNAVLTTFNVVYKRHTNFTCMYSADYVVDKILKIKYKPGTRITCE